MPSDNIKMVDARTIDLLPALTINKLIAEKTKGSPPLNVAMRQV